MLFCCIIDVKFLNVLISSFIVCSSPQAIPDSDGWVPVERPDARQEEFPDEAIGVWVVFSKKLEGEKFLVRFPDDPHYRYYPGGIQIDAVDGEDLLRLRVEKRAEGDPEPLFKERLEEIRSLPDVLLLKVKKSALSDRLDVFYRVGEKWVWERIQSSSKLLYTFHTESPGMAGQAHRQLISSLDIF
jgi:hypothetical protein